MWIFTTDGFFSVVQDHRDKNMVHVRARRREHLEGLLRTLATALRNRYSWKMPQILGTDTADYPVRVIMSRVVWADYLEYSGKTINYDNFKSRVSGSGEWAEHYHGALMSVWSILNRHLDGRERNWEWETPQMSLFDDQDNWDEDGEQPTHIGDLLKHGLE